MSEENINPVPLVLETVQPTMPSGEVETPKAPEAFDPYKIIKELTLAEAEFLGGEPGNERAIMKNKYAFSGSEIQYWGGTEYVGQIEKALILPLCEHVSKYKHVSGVSFCVLNPIPEGVRTKRSNLEEHFSENFMKLMQSQPSNPIVRGFMTKVLKKEPPVEATTIELLREWVEMNFKKPARDSLRGPVRGQAAAQNRARHVLELEVKLTETETGRCYYSCKKHCTDVVEVELEWLRDRIGDGADMDGIVEQITEKAENLDLPDWNYDDYDHSDYEAGDSENFRATFTRSIIEEVESFLYNHDEELLDTLQSRD